MKLWGCHNRAEYLPGYMLHGTSKETGLPTSTYIPYVMATDCQYTLTRQGQADTRCDGCKWKNLQEKQ